MEKTKIVSTMSVLLLAASTFPMLAFAAKENKIFSVADVGFTTDFVFSLPLASSESEEMRIGELCVEPFDAFMLPPETKAKMSREELYELWAVPGYFTPQQLTAPDSLLLNNPEPVLVNVIVDEEMREQCAIIFGYPDPSLCPWDVVYGWAGSILEGGDDPFEINFGIDMQRYVTANWDSPDNYNIYDMLYFVDDFDPTSVGCDILVLMTGQDDSTGYAGLAWPAPNGRHAVMKTTTDHSCALFQHETSHFFGAPDHGWAPMIWCVMSYYHSSSRAWCAYCMEQIDSYKFRFD